MADLLQGLLAENDLLDLPDDDSDQMLVEEESGELKEEANTSKASFSTSPLVEKAIAESSKIVSSSKEAKMTEAEMENLVEQLEVLDDKFMGLQDQKILMDLASGKPRLLAMVTTILGFMPLRRGLFLPGLIWACLTHAKEFYGKMWKVILISVIFGFSLCEAGNCQSDTNITYNAGKAVLHTSVMKYQTQLFTEEIDLTPFAKLRNNLQKRVESVALSVGNSDDPPLQCDEAPMSPTNLLHVGKILNNNHQFDGIYVTPIECNRRYTIVATTRPIGRYHREAIQANNDSVPIFCSYFPSNIQKIHMLAATSRDLNVPIFKNNPLTIFMNFMKQDMINPDTQNNCAFLGQLQSESDSAVIKTGTGMHECIELCHSLQHGTVRKSCAAASFNILESTCEIRDEIDEYSAQYLNDNPPSPAYAEHYVINFRGKCLSRNIDYTRPEVMIGSVFANVANVCEYLLPEYRAGLKNKLIGKITDGAKQLAIKMLAELRNLTGSIENKYGVIDRYRRSTDGFNWNSGYNSGKSFIRMIQQISEATKLGIKTWKSFSAADQRPGFNNANLLQRMSSGLKSRGQQADVFEFNQNKWPRIINKLDVFNNQYSRLLNNSIAKVDIKRLYSDFTKVRKWVLDLLAKPVPISVDLNQTKNYLYSPIVIKRNSGNTLFRRFLRILPDKKDLNNLLFAQFPTTAETYKQDNFKSSFGPSNQWENCLSGDESSCKVIHGKTKQDVTILPYGDQFDSSLVAINRKSFQLIVSCNEQNTYFKRHTGYTVALIPPNCKVVIDNSTWIEPVPGSVSACAFKILFSVEIAYPSNSPPSLLVMIKENMRFSYIAFICSIFGITLISIVYLNYCYKIQRRQSWPNTFSSRLKRSVNKKKDNVKQLNISRPMKEEVEEEIPLPMEVITTPAASIRGREFTF